MDSYAYTKALVNGNLLAIMKAHRSLDKEVSFLHVGRGNGIKLMKCPRRGSCYT